MAYVLRASGGAVRVFALFDNDDSSGGIFVQRGLGKQLEYVSATPPVAE